MRLSLLSERRKSSRSIRLFHGSDGSPGIFNSGLIPSNPRKNSASMSSSSDAGAIFLTPSLSIALYYGRTVVEVLANSSTTQLAADEESFPLGEIPSDDNKRAWNSFWNRFDKSVPPPNDAERQIFLSGYDKARKNAKRYADKMNTRFMVNQWDDEIVGAVRKIFVRRSIRPSGTEGWEGNAMLLTTQPITFRGRNRIVGIYEFDYLPKTDPRPGVPPTLVCKNVVYSNDGSISVGDVVKRAFDWMG